MSSITEINLLIEELNQVAPPPKLPKGVNNVRENSGLWKLALLGAGLYALRAVYEDKQGNPIEVRMENEVKGFLPAVTIAVRFSLSIMSSSRHHWMPV
jgi:hypothetical protein